jgi:carnitine 3-dehydrogenase
MNNIHLKIAIVGTGVIGASWATHFLANGFTVVATDPGEGAEARLRGWVDCYWPTVEKLGLAEGAAKDNLSFTTDLAEAVKGAAFIQKSGPERLDIESAQNRGITPRAKQWNHWQPAVLVHVAENVVHTCRLVPRI